MLLNVTVIVTNVRRNRVDVEMHKFRGIVDPSSNFHLATLLQHPTFYKKIFLESLILLPMPIPGEETEYKFVQMSLITTYTYDDLVVCIGMLKLFFILRLIEKYAVWSRLVEPKRK